MPAVLGGIILIGFVGLAVFVWDALRPRVEGRTVDQLRAELLSPDPVARRHAASDLGRLNSAAANAVPQLSAALRDSDAGVRAAAAEALGKLSPASEGAIGGLTDAIADPDPWVRMNAALALLRLKEKSRPAIPALVAAARDEQNDIDLDVFHHTVREVAVLALGEAAAGSADAVPTFTMLLDQPASDGLRRCTAIGLGLAEKHARPTAAKLRRLLTDPNEDVRLAAADALGRIGVPRDGEVAHAEFDNLELAESERARLWEIEHRVNVLNKYGLGPLAVAIKAGDEPSVTRILSSTFVGTEPTKTAGRKTDGYATVDRRVAGGTPDPLSREGFAARLLEWRQLFAPAPSVSLATATLSAKDEAQVKGGWVGDVLVRLVGSTADGGLAEVTATVRVEVSAVTEEALSGAGWLSAGHIRKVAIARSPGPMFVDVAAARGLNTKLHDNWTEPPPVGDGPPPVITSGGVYVCDFNLDGFLDLLVVDLRQVSLYRGKAGGGFDEVTAAVGLSTIGTAAAACWADLDGDGWPDLLLGAGVFRNIDGRAFEEVTARSNLRQLAGLSAIIPADFDRDGKLDLYLTRTSPPGNQSWLNGTGNGGQGNRLLRNLGDWRFEDVTSRSGTHGGYKSSFTAAWLDADGDGWPDLHVPNEFGDGNLLMNQKDGTFRPTRLAEHTADFGTMGLAAGDLDNDGKVDLYCANMYSKAGTRVIGNLKPGTYPPMVMAKLRRFVAG
ncbi:MAG: FG-GAP-like repeat-containing protein, partial [Fimbriiglobus sp.]|nr:FG-GAP-like repeat-containing protein [Fimbriiglobus sp.]